MLRDRQVSWQQNMSSSTPSSSYDPFYDPHDKYSKAPRIRPITGCSFMCCLWCILIGAAVFYYGIIDIEMVAPEGYLELFNYSDFCLLPHLRLYCTYIPAWIIF